MATTNMNYDHPAYTVPVVFSAGTTAGANGATTKFAAYTAMKIMAVVQAPVATSTSASQGLIYTKSGTTTATSTLTALTSASTAAISNALATPVTLAKGDQFWYTHGTDATAAMAVAIEARLIPGADVTAV